jgi:hypothetical protein
MKLAERLLSNHDRTIWDIVWKIHRQSGRDVEDLRGQAMLIAMKAATVWNPKFSGFNAYLKRSLQNSLWRWAHKNPNPVTYEETPDYVAHTVHPADWIAFKEDIASLPKEAFFVARLILDTPSELLELFADKSPTEIKTAIRAFLTTKHGWSPRKVQVSFDLLRKALAR